MRYYKQTDGDYIHAIGTGFGGEEIARNEYEHIFSVIRSCPIPEAGYNYFLRTDLTWEKVEAPATEDLEVSEADYIAALTELGVVFDEEE